MQISRRARVPRNSFWATPNLQFVAHKMKGLRRAQNKLFGQLSSPREREPPDSSWRILQPIQAVCGIGVETQQMAPVNSCQLVRKIPVSAKLKGIERNIKTGWRSAVNSNSQDPSKGTWFVTAREFQWLSRVSFV